MLRLLQILGRTASQIKQMRKGLKETGVWSILSERRDVAEAVFPCEKEVICSPQVILLWGPMVDLFIFTFELILCLILVKGVITCYTVYCFNF